MDLSFDSLGRCLFQRDQVSDLQTHCVDWKERGGCHWRGKLSEHEIHLESCPHQLVACSLDEIGLCRDCPGEVMRKDMNYHYVTSLDASAVDDFVDEHLQIQERCVILTTENHALKKLPPAMPKNFQVIRSPTRRDETYCGETLNGLKHGLGTLQGPSTSSSSSSSTSSSSLLFYCGGWRQGERHGEGVQQSSEGAYSGSFVSGEQMGRGVLAYTAESSSTVMWYYKRRCLDENHQLRQTDEERQSELDG
jgi:hypothetical protein